MTAFFAVLLYAATAVLVGGLAVRIRDYARTPAPLKIPTTPAPTTRGGVVLRMLREVALFESLFRSNLWTWACGWLFHAGLALVLLRHLRYFVEPVWGWVAFVQPFGIYAGFAMAGGLTGLWVRRIFVPRVRYISTPSDHLMIVAAAGDRAVGPGDEIRRAHRRRRGQGVRARPDVLRLAAAAGGRPGLRHLGLVAVLMLIFPFSKLLHAPGVFFSPTRNQVDDPRERRHLAPWAAHLDPKP